MQKSRTFELGQVVRILSGRGKDRYSIVIQLIDDRFVGIVDGDIRKFDRPKKKNRSHLEPQPYVCEEVAELLKQNNRVPNAKLRFGLQQWLHQQIEEVQ